MLRAILPVRPMSRLSSSNQPRRGYHSMNKAVNGRKLLFVKPNNLENPNRHLFYNEKMALAKGGLFLVTAVWLTWRFGPPQIWYIDKMISLKLKLYNRFAKEKIEVVEDFNYEELKLEDRPREKPYAKKRGKVEIEGY